MVGPCDQNAPGKIREAPAGYTQGKESGPQVDQDQVA